MIIDRIQLAGKDAYFKNGADKTNLVVGATSRTASLAKGKQWEISAIELLIESTGDLTDLFNFQESPLLSITVMKEMFPMLFADPFRHRVHTVAGFDDFKRGTIENGKVLDVEGIPTIVSVGTEDCKWKSPLYQMPEPISLAHASWELAASRKTPRENFKYSLSLEIFDANQNSIQIVSLANNLDPTKPRKAENLALPSAAFYQIEFTAKVLKDASIHEKHTMLVGESIGTPLLRAVNLLEPVNSIYDIHSLQELLSLSSEYHLFEFQGQPLKKMIATLDLSATLVHSENQHIENDDLYDPKSRFEFVEIVVKSDVFSNVEAKLVGEELVKPKYQ
ncbi:MAG TPA: hypothetical protein VK892_14255 [Pyrinomonadaceae bacterium]|nr:hypothetical protein [Pyrinomonadaceae bacterium]